MLLIVYHVDGLDGGSNLLVVLHALQETRPFLHVSHPLVQQELLGDVGILHQK